MTLAPVRAFGLLLAALAVTASAAIVIDLHAHQQELAPRPRAQRPTLLLVTSLPLIFSEGFSLQGGGSAALNALQSRYRVAPIGVTDEAELSQARLLLMAHPLAQPAEDLVALDHWVRNGGRLLLLADPMLEWPSSLRVGDKLRPPPMFMDTGLLEHWHLSLVPPAERGPQIRNLGGFDIVTVSPGTLSGACRISAGGLIADCRISHGRAIVVADADFLDRNRLGPKAAHNLDGLLAVLAKLESK